MGRFNELTVWEESALRFQKMNEWIDDEKNMSVRCRM